MPDTAGVQTAYAVYFRVTVNMCMTEQSDIAVPLFRRCRKILIRSDVHQACAVRHENPMVPDFKNSEIRDIIEIIVSPNLRIRTISPYRLPAVPAMQKIIRVRKQRRNLFDWIHGSVVIGNTYDFDQLLFCHIRIIRETVENTIENNIISSGETAYEIQSVSL